MKTTCCICVLSYLLSLRVIMPTESDTDQRMEACPATYWDEPSSRCSSFLLSILQSIHPENDFWFVPHVVNSTCSAWHRTNSCYKHLIQLCNKDETATSELRMHSHRFQIFSLACDNPASKGDNKFVVDCFIPRMKRIMQCSRSFDNVFRNYVTEKNFRHACRVVSATMNCFNVIRSQIAEGCNDDVSETFISTFVQPLADQSRGIVLKHCEMMPSYSEYFTSRAGSLRDVSSLAICCCCLVVFLVVEQIRGLLLEFDVLEDHRLGFDCVSFFEHTIGLSTRFLEHTVERIGNSNTGVSFYAVICEMFMKICTVRHWHPIGCYLIFWDSIDFFVIRSFFQSLSSPKTSPSSISSPYTATETTSLSRSFPQAFVAYKTRLYLNNCSIDRSINIEEDRYYYYVNEYGRLCP